MDKCMPHLDAEAVSGLSQETRFSRFQVYQWLPGNITSEILRVDITRSISTPKPSSAGADREQLATVLKLAVLLPASSRVDESATTSTAKWLKPQPRTYTQ